MSNTDETNLKHGNTGQKHKMPGSRNLVSRMMDNRANENMMQIYDMMERKALDGDHDASVFILNKVWPNIKPGRFVTFKANDMTNIKEIVETEQNIFKEVGKGELTVEEGEKLFTMAETLRKGIETEILIERMQLLEANMEKRFLDAGI